MSTIPPLKSPLTSGFKDPAALSEVLQNAHRQGIGFLDAIQSLPLSGLEAVEAAASGDQERVDSLRAEIADKVTNAMRHALLLQESEIGFVMLRQAFNDLDEKSASANRTPGDPTDRGCLTDFQTFFDVCGRIFAHVQKHQDRALQLPTPPTGIVGGAIVPPVGVSDNSQPTTKVDKCDGEGVSRPDLSKQEVLTLRGEGEPVTLKGPSGIRQFDTLQEALEFVFKEEIPSESEKRRDDAEALPKGDATGDSETRWKGNDDVEQLLGLLDHLDVNDPRKKLAGAKAISIAAQAPKPPGKFLTQRTYSRMAEAARKFGLPLTAKAIEMEAAIAEGLQNRKKRAGKLGNEIVDRQFRPVGWPINSDGEPLAPRPARLDRHIKLRNAESLAASAKKAGWTPGAARSGDLVGDIMSRRGVGKGISLRPFEADAVFDQLSKLRGDVERLVAESAQVAPVVTDPRDDLRCAMLGKCVTMLRSLSQVLKEHGGFDPHLKLIGRMQRDLLNSLPNGFVFKTLPGTPGFEGLKDSLHYLLFREVSKVTDRPNRAGDVLDRVRFRHHPLDMINHAQVTEEQLALPGEDPSGFTGPWRLLGTSELPTGATLSYRQFNCQYWSSTLNKWTLGVAKRDGLTYRTRAPWPNRLPSRHPDLGAWHNPQDITELELQEPLNAHERDSGNKSGQADPMGFVGPWRLALSAELPVPFDLAQCRFSACQWWEAGHGWRNGAAASLADSATVRTRCPLPIMTNGKLEYPDVVHGTPLEPGAEVPADAGSAECCGGNCR